MNSVNQSHKVFIAEEYVSSLSISQKLAADKAPKYFDVLKIDIDAFDFAILKSIFHAEYRPKLVMMEIKPDIPPPFIRIWRKGDSHLLQAVV